MLVSLDILKKHLKVMHDHQNDLIEIYAEAAEERVSSYIGRPIYLRASDMPLPGAAAYDPYAIVVDRRITVAILILTELSWTGLDAEDRQPGVATMPNKVADILSGLRVWRSPGAGVRHASP